MFIMFYDKRFKYIFLIVKHFKMKLRLPYEIWEKIVIILIKGKRYKDLNELKKSYLFSTIIYNNKKLYIEKLFQNPRKRLYLSYGRYLKYDRTDIKNFIRYTPILKLIQPTKLLFDFSDFWKSKTLDDVVVPSEIINYEIPENKSIIPQDDIIIPQSVIYMIRLTKQGDICSNLILIGKNITKVEILINGCSIIIQYYLKANMTNIKLFDCGIILALLRLSYIDLAITAQSLEKVYGKVLYLPFDDVDRMVALNKFETNKYFTNYRNSFRETYLTYMYQMCMPRHHH